MSDNHGYCDKCGCIANTHRPDCVSQQSEIERLRTFIKVFDIWYESEYACKGKLYEDLESAREALGNIEDY